jgi:Flp pilus assembly protein TadD
VTSLNKASQLDPKNGEIQKDLADVYTVMGDSSAAAAATRRAEELSKQSFTPATK